MITDLRLQNFRSYSDDSFEFSPGVNLVVGPNASGKTNLLEAVLVLCRGSSYRAKDAELVQFDKPWGRLDGHLADGSQRTLKLTTEPTPDKTYELSGKTYKRLTLAHTIPAVLFEPNHLQLLSGGPERRRDYLDDLLEQTTAGYGTLRRQYRRALAQRNALLKQPGQDVQTKIFPWNVRLSQLAGQIVRARSQLASQLDDQIGTLYQALSHAKTKVGLTYDGRWPAEAYESNFLNKLDSSLALDTLRGFTSTGPHREDLVVLFDKRPAPETASRGEARTAILALKICELQIIEAARETTPLLLLDDVFSELDGKRRHALTDYLAAYQTFITTTDADIVLKHFAERCNVIPLS
ncbi:MAG TPA: DNA replication and repair protein RecF [Verrucomicrobiae bacterium]|jgi:DNA replication and repair protein RecF|nr:DNA replication and repair protein RecF [Verrucomicrobiae bacterium]